MADDLVFKALADPSRRRLLDVLYERDGQTLGQLSGQLDMTRFGTMKHLRLLEGAGLVTSRRRGREKLHFLNPVPIRLIHDRWIGKYAESTVATMAALKAVLEGENALSNQTQTEATTTQVYRVFIRSTPERIWEAITTPEFTRRYFHGSQVDVELTPGGPMKYWSPDRSHLFGDNTVLEVDPPRRLVATWTALWDEELAAEQPSRVTWEIEPQDGGFCLLTVVHDQLEGAPKTAREVSGQGWMLVLSGLKTLLETGEPLRQPGS